jgi:hypothetical protein
MLELLNADRPADIIHRVRHAGAHKPENPGAVAGPADGGAYSTKSPSLMTCTPSARRALPRSST